MKGKSIIDAVEGVTSKWAKQRKAEERAANARANRYYAMTRQREDTIGDIVRHVLPEAWSQASGDGQYPTLARQLYYATRPLLQQYTDKPLGYGYFSQTLLPDFLSSRGLDWDVVYDARGNFHEPHTKTTVPLGTLQVRHYVQKVRNYQTPTSAPSITIDARFPTTGPRHRYSAILFIEKEGFQPLLQAARIAEHFDLAIMSTKGMSVTASRTLVEQMCGDYDVKLLVLHDFDISSFTIAGTIASSTRRYAFNKQFDVVDLGLRLTDTEDMWLESEDVFFPERTDFYSKTLTLQRYGATAEEIAFLVERQERVELNAMTSPQFVDFLERKLQENGVGKVVPDTKTLRIAAQRAARIARINEEIDAISELVGEVDVPDDLEAQVREKLVERPELTWDEALVSLMGGKVAPLGDRDDDDEDWDDDE